MLDLVISFWLLRVLGITPMHNYLFAGIASVAHAIENATQLPAVGWRCNAAAVVAAAEASGSGRALSEWLCLQAFALPAVCSNIL